MGEMKSAWEIAMKKMERLGNFSADDVRKQEERRFTTVARVLAQKYLSSTDIRQLEVELNRYNPEERTLLGKPFIATLIEAMHLQDYETGKRILYAIALTASDERTREFVAGTAEILEEYKRLEQERKQGVDKKGREVLHQLGISGDAVKAINSGASSEWQESLDELARPYEERLNKCRQEFLSAD